MEKKKAMNIVKKGAIIITSIALLGMSVVPAFAHVSVKPLEVGVGERTNFIVSVPTEEKDPTVQVRIIIPDGVQSVRPNVKLGWKIQLKKDGEGEGAKVTEIIWSGGTIPAEQRDEFVFSAQAPTQEGSLVWKAYQTYGDGDVVAWDEDPQIVAEYSKNNPPKEGVEDDHNAPRPYSQTKIINDLNVSPSTPSGNSITKENTRAITYSLIAVALSVSALAMQLYGRKK